MTILPNLIIKRERLKSDILNLNNLKIRKVMIFNSIRKSTQRHNTYIETNEHNIEILVHPIKSV